MRILIIAENYYPHIGGVEVVFKNLAERLANKSHDVHVVTHRVKGTEKFEILNKAKIHRISSFGSRYWFTLLAFPKAFLLAKNCDIIHTTTFTAAPLAAVVSKLRKKPCVITVHEVWVDKWDEYTEMNRLSAFIHNLMEKAIYRLGFDKYICVSNSTRKELTRIGIDSKKSVAIYDGFDYDDFNPEKYSGKEIRAKYELEGKFVYMAYGRPGVSKGFEYLINAVPIISRNIPNSKLLLILSKDKAYRKRYGLMMDLIETLGIKDEVIVLEPVKYKELPNYIKAADCIVVPSLTEGFGYSAVEACAMERPLVATNKTSLPEVVWGRYALVEPKSPEQIADGVLKIYRGKYGYSKKKIFSWDKNINSTIKIYQELLGNLNKS